MKIYRGERKSTSGLLFREAILRLLTLILYIYRKFTISGEFPVHNLSEFNTKASCLKFLDNDGIRSV